MGTVLVTLFRAFITLLGSTNLHVDLTLEPTLSTRVSGLGFRV